MRQFVVHRDVLPTQGERVDDVNHGRAVPAHGKKPRRTHIVGGIAMTKHLTPTKPNVIGSAMFIAMLR